MRFSMIFLLSLIFITSTFAQRSDMQIPKEVEDAFLLQYPDAIITNWELEENNYRAQFNWKEREYISVFNPKGIWMETRTDLEYNQLPLAVQEGFRESKYGLWHVENVTRVELPDNKILYRYNLIKDDVVYRLDLDTSGDVISE